MKSTSHTKDSLPNFLPDEPSCSDHFGSHERVASAVASVILERQDIKVIGLLGTWGSGKSTAIRLVETKIKELSGKKHDETYFFTFDAWLHQSDPPRRSFLEELVAFLVDKKLTTHEKWKGNLAKLKRQVEERETSSTPTLTSLGNLILLSLLLFPLGAQFVSYQWLDVWLKKTFNSFILDNIFISGASILLLPLIIFLAMVSLKFFFHPCVINPVRKMFGFQPLEKMGSITSLFLNKGVEKVWEKTTKDPDPTTIEFQETFRHIMNEVSVGHPQRKFVFVIDNLDRLPELEAISLWGTIRSLFLGSNNATCSRKASPALPTILLPIDMDAVKRMFAATHSEEKIAQRLAESFMDKTFDLTFYVPRPVLSHWKDYFRDQLKSVFAESLPENEMHQAAVLYEKFLTRNNLGSPTPRKINKLINLIATFWMQWKEQGVAFQSVCYYAINQADIDGKILEEVKSGKDDIQSYSSAWQKEISALHFGAKPDEAVQILIGQDVLNAIAERNVTAFSDLFAKVSGFADVCRQSIEGELQAAPTNVKFFLNAAYLLDELNSPNLTWINEIWPLLQRGVCGEKALKALDETTAPSLHALLKNCEDKDASSVLSSVRNAMQNLEEPKLEEKAYSMHFYNVTKVLFDTAKQRGIAWEEIRVPKSSMLFLETITFAKDNEELQNSYRTEYSDQALMSDLAKSLQTDKPLSFLSDCTIALLKTGHTSWAPLVEELDQYVRNNSAANKRMQSVLFCLGYLYDRDPLIKEANTLLEQYRSENIYDAKFHEALAENAEDTAAQILALSLFVNGAVVTTPDGSSWDEFLKQHASFATDINKHLKSIEYFDYESPLTTLAENIKAVPQLGPVAKAVVAHQVKNGGFGTLSTEKAIVGLDSCLKCLLSEDQTHFLHVLSKAENFENVLTSHALDTHAIKLLNLMLDSSDQEIQGKAVKCVQISLQNYTQENWKPVIESGKEVYALIQKCKGKLTITSNLYNALKDSIEGLMAAKKQPVALRWFDLCDLLTDAMRKTVFKDVGDRIWRQGAPQNPLVVFSSGGEDFVRFCSLHESKEKADAAVRECLFNMLSAEGISFINQHAALLKKWVNASSTDTQKALLEKLSETYTQLMAASDRDDDKILLETVFKAWDLPLPQADTNYSNLGDEIEVQKESA